MDGSNSSTSETLYVSPESNPDLNDSSDDLLQDQINHSHTPDTSDHAHVHSVESLRRIVNRLSRIEGHIRGIKTMVQQNSPCPDVLLQIAAVRGALDRVARIVLDEHLNECITRAAQNGNIEQEIQLLQAALDRFLP